MATGKRKTEAAAAAPAMVCEHCRYFVPKEDRNECRYDRPDTFVDMEDGGQVTVFPLVESGWWCGKWAARLNS